MIYSKYKKFVYVAIPKTGTRSVYELCLNQYSCHIYKEHWNIIPDEYKNYYAFITVRNPYDRAVSMWYFVINSIGSTKSHIKFKEGVPSGSFVDFMKFLIVERKNNLENPFFRTQAEYLKPNRFDMILEMEKLGNDFNKLPFLHHEEELKHLNKTIDVSNIIDVPRKVNAFNYINQEAIDLINEYYAEDFELLSQYKKILTL